MKTNPSLKLFKVLQKAQLCLLAADTTCRALCRSRRLPSVHFFPSTLYVIRLCFWSERTISLLVQAFSTELELDHISLILIVQSHGKKLNLKHVCSSVLNVDVIIQPVAVNVINVLSLLVLLN